jgi:hypothetical protein
MRSFLILLAATTAGLAPAIAATPVKMATTLTGAAEVPGPGADKGAGEATLAFDTDKGQVCYMLHASGTDTPTMAHIHKGAAGVAGGVVVPLTPPTKGMSEGCVPVAADLLGAILATPSDYYVNIHTTAFPKGALRGQLK